MIPIYELLFLAENIVRTYGGSLHMLFCRNVGKYQLFLLPYMEFSVAKLLYILESFIFSVLVKTYTKLIF